MIQSQRIIFGVFGVLVISDNFVHCGQRKLKENGSKENLWEQDLGDQFKIDASTDGLQKVHLKCGANSMFVQLETEENFEGVMYTRGSFYDQNEPCFVKPKPGKSARSLTMRFPLDKCQTVQNGDVYSNVVVVQHDPDLVTPGDAAFQLECDFRKPRSIQVGANMKARDRLANGSKIKLTSPDPTQNTNNLDPGLTVYSDTESVTFDPKTMGRAQGIRGTVETISITPKINKINDEL